MSAWLRLYPRAWRERYGDEVAQLLASEPATLRLWLDLIAGAIDAHTNPRWTPVAAPDGGQRTMHTFLSSCGRSDYPPARKRASALILLGASLALVLVYLGLRAAFGASLPVQALLYSTFNIALVLSSLPTGLANYPRRVRLSLAVLGVVASYAFFLAVARLAG